jgi:hypothetical protein
LGLRGLFQAKLYLYFISTSDVGYNRLKMSGFCMDIFKIFVDLSDELIAYSEVKEQ